MVEEEEEVVAAAAAALPIPAMEEDKTNIPNRPLRITVQALPITNLLAATHQVRTLLRSLNYLAQRFSSRGKKKRRKSVTRLVEILNADCRRRASHRYQYLLFSFGSLL